MSVPNIFAPRTTVSIGATTTSSNASIGKGIQRVHNAGSVTAFLAFGTSDVAATSTGLPLPAGIVELLNAESNTYAAAICSTAGGTATIYLTKGEGF